MPLLFLFVFGALIYTNMLVKILSLFPKNAGLASAITFGNFIYGNVFNLFNTILCKQTTDPTIPFLISSLHIV